MARGSGTATADMARTLPPPLTRGKSRDGRPKPSRRVAHLAGFALFLALSFHPAPGGAVPQAMGGGVGVVMPTQVLDGPGVQLMAGWRWGFQGDRLWLIGETGLTRTRLTALTASLAVPGGTAQVRTDFDQWSVPLLMGLGWRWGPPDGAGVDAELLAGGLIGRTRTRTGAANVGRASETADVTVDPLVRARMTWTWAVRPGGLGLGGGWQHHLRLGPAPASDLRATGPFVEATWRVVF